MSNETQKKHSFNNKTFFGSPLKKFLRNFYDKFDIPKESFVISMYYLNKFYLMNKEKKELTDNLFKNIILKGFWLSLWLNKMSIEEKNKLYSYLSELIIKKVLFTKVEKVFYINDIKEAINTASDFNRDGKILVTTSKA